MLGVRYCGGWTDYANMGISCLAAYDYAEDAYRVFDDSNRHEFARLVERHELLIGFNNLNFDNRVIEAAWGIVIPRERCFDILQAFWAANGLGPDYVYATHSGYSLNAVCAANGLGSKTGSGVLAPLDYQSGKFAKVFDYCLHDVWLTKRLFDKLRATGKLRNPRTGLDDVLWNYDLNAASSARAASSATSSLTTLGSATP